MPIDSAQKRRSAAGVPFLPLGPGVTPNASKPVAWRQQVAWSYSGITVAELVITPQMSLRLPSRTRKLSLSARIRKTQLPARSRKLTLPESR